MKSNIFFKKKNIKIDKIFPNIKLNKKFVVDSVKPLINATSKDITFLTQLSIKKIYLKLEPKYVLHLIN